MTPSDHDLLVGIDGRLARLEKNLLGNGQPGTCALHSTRLAALEDWRSRVAGAIKTMLWIVATVLPLGGLVTAVLLRKHG